MGTVRTVLGDIDSKELGFTLAHDHVYFNPNGAKLGDKIDAWTMTDYESQKTLLKEFKDYGGGAIVDASWSKIAGRNPEYMKRASAETGVHIIGCVGTLHDDMVEDWEKNMDVDELTEYFIKEITVGMDDTDIKAGWIKGSGHYMYMSEWEKKELKAACRAAMKTGVAVHMHTDIGTAWEEMLEIVKDEGMPFSQFGIAHIDRNPDYYVHKTILSTGAYLIHDGPGKIKYYPDEMRVELVKKLVADGYGDKIMFCNDMGKREYHSVYGGAPGWNYIKKRWLPRLLEEGFTEEQVHKFNNENPQTFYSLREVKE